MKKYVFILLWLCQGIAGAHGPTPQKIEERVTINATQEAVSDPVGVGISKDGKFTYSTHPERGLVTNWFSDDLSIVDLAAEKETRRIPAGKGARAFGRFISP